MKKITIFVLHLGYGGIEVATTNLANMLSSNYNVEIISFYNIYGKPVYELDSKVNVKFLYNGKPNRDEFIENLKKLKVIRTFKEGLKALKILYLKKKLIINEIKKCNSDLIISTRVELTELLSKYYVGNAILVSQEHSYHHNNEKYINRIKKSLKNIDYFMPVSRRLAKFYKNKIKTGTKVMYGPLCLDYLPDKESKKVNKNIISIGRLSKEKGFLDLIDVFKIINDNDKECYLHIIGDGSEREKIEKKIDELELNDYVILYGYKDKEFIREKLNDMSLYLMTSYEESFGLVLLEASSFGIPSIAFSSAEGACEIIRNDTDGYLIEARNKDEMAKKALELLDNKNKLSSFGHESRIKSEEYSYDNIKEKWLGIVFDMFNK